MKSLHVTKELRIGLFTMSFLFVWGILIFWIISALFNKMWLWHLSWSLVPILSLLLTLIIVDVEEDYSIYQVTPKQIWTELGPDKITIIDYHDGVPRKFTEY